MSSGILETEANNEKSVLILTIFCIAFGLLIIAISLTAFCLSKYKQRELNSRNRIRKDKAIRIIPRVAENNEERLHTEAGIDLIKMPSDDALGSDSANASFRATPGFDLP